MVGQQNHPKQNQKFQVNHIGRIDFILSDIIFKISHECSLNPA